jgi:hypothetical protein
VVRRGSAASTASPYPGKGCVANNATTETDYVHEAFKGVKIHATIVHFAARARR